MPKKRKPICDKYPHLCCRGRPCPRRPFQLLDQTLNFLGDGASTLLDEINAIFQSFNDKLAALDEFAQEQDFLDIARELEQLGDTQQGIDSDLNDAYAVALDVYDYLESSVPTYDPNPRTLIDLAHFQMMRGRLLYRMGETEAADLQFHRAGLYNALARISITQEQN